MKCSDNLIDKSSSVEAVAYRTITAFTLHHLGHRDKAEKVIDSLCQSVFTPDEFIYDHQSYLPNTYQRIQRLAEIVRGRDIALLLYGPSIADLATCATNLATSTSATPVSTSSMRWKTEF